MKHEHTHAALVKIAYRWVLKNGSCGFAFKEMSAQNDSGEIPDVLGFGSWDHTVLIEVKVSRGDFLCDKKKSFRIDPKLGMGRRRYYCCPTGLIKKEELPEGWGLIYVNDKGKAVSVHRAMVPHPNPAYAARGSMVWYEHECNRKAETAMMYSALRRLHLKVGLDEVYTPIGPTFVPPDWSSGDDPVPL